MEVVLKHSQRLGMSLVSLSEDRFEVFNMTNSRRIKEEKEGSLWVDSGSVDVESNADGCDLSREVVMKDLWLIEQPQTTSNHVAIWDK